MQISKLILLVLMITSCSSNGVITDGQLVQHAHPDDNRFGLLIPTGTPPQHAEHVYANGDVRTALGFEYEQKRYYMMLAMLTVDQNADRLVKDISFDDFWLAEEINQGELTVNEIEVR